LGKAYTYLSMKLCVFVAIVNFVNALKFTQVLGPAIGFNVTWDPPVGGQTSICASARTTLAWIGVGFREPGFTQMNGSDIVVGFTTSQGQVVVKAMYSNDTAGYPGGISTLKISAPSFSSVGGVTTLCFTRPVASGHVPLTDSTKVIWANGPILNDDLDYHGSDTADPTGKTQTHRSGDTQPVRFLSGPLFD